MQIGAATSAGHRRERNEDAHWYNGRCFVVCDGMGGHQGGEVASALAVETIRSYEFRWQDIGQEIASAIHRAHNRIIRAANSRQELYGMGTTVTMGAIAAVDGEYQLTLGHVGDSRAYLVADERMIQLTQDDSVVAALMREGQLTAEQAVSHPQRSVLTQAVGAGTIDVQIVSRKVQPGVRLLICTDGLSSVVEASSILRLLDANTAEQAAESLVEAANARGGPDNVTVLVIDLP